MVRKCDLSEVKALIETKSIPIVKFQGERRYLKRQLRGYRRELI